MSDLLIERRKIMKALLTCLRKQKINGDEVYIIYRSELNRVFQTFGYPYRKIISLNIGYGEFAIALLNIAKTLGMKYIVHVRKKPTKKYTRYILVENEEKLERLREYLNKVGFKYDVFNVF